MGLVVAFNTLPSAAGIELRLMAGSQAIPVERWPLEAPAALLASVDVVRELVTAGQADEGDDVVLVEHAAIAALSAREAGLIALPQLTDACARVSTTGLVTGAGFKAGLQWVRPTGQPIVGAVRTGSYLRIGGRDWRLSSGLFAIGEAVDALAQATAPDDRLRAIARLRDALPGSQPTGAVLASGLTQIDVLQADAFSLDLLGEGSDAKLVPILHRAGSEQPLLPEHYKPSSAPITSTVSARLARSIRFPAVFSSCLHPCCDALCRRYGGINPRLWPISMPYCARRAAPCARPWMQMTIPQCSMRSSESLSRPSPTPTG